MYRRVAVALDPTTESGHALRWAVTIARRSNCPLDLIHVASTATYGTDLYGAAVLRDDDVEQMQRDAEQRLRRLADEIRSTGVVATPVVLQGQVASSLGDQLRESGADLVVLTTHDRRRLERLVLGSVSEAIVRHTHVPVLLIRAREGAPPPIGTPVTATRILVPLDGSPFGEQILPHAVRFAQVMESELTLLGVVEPMLAAAIATEMGGPPSAAFMPATTVDGRTEERAALESDALKRAAEPLRAQRVTVRTTLLTHGQPGHAIVEYAKQHKMDLIALTTHGHGALKRLVAGGVSEHVLRHSSVPVLMYRPEHAASA